MELYKKLGLPTFPIANGMILGNRNPDALEWLLDHGVIQSDIYSYKKIIKLSQDEYRLVQCKDDRYNDEEETLAGAPSLQTLIETEHLSIEYWYWYIDFTGKD